LNADQRAAVVAEARTWLATPYHHAAAVKGAGVDCAFLLISVFHACGLLPAIDPRPYPHDWHLHRDDERFMGWVEQYADPVADPLPGDIALYQFGRCVSHGALVVEWPMVIHAYVREGCTYADGMRGQLANRLVGFWRLREAHQ